MQFVYKVNLNPIGQILCWVRINPDPTQKKKKKQKFIYIFIYYFEWI